MCEFMLIMPSEVKTNRAFDFFQIKRPVKQSLKNARSVPHIDKLNDEDEITHKDRLFVRHSGTLPSSRSSKKYGKKKSGGENMETNTEEVTNINNSVRLLAEKYETLNNHQKVQSDFRRSLSFTATNPITDEKIELPRIKSQTKVEDTIQETRTDNNIHTHLNKKGRAKSDSSFLKYVVEKREQKKNIGSFEEAKTDQETETYRRQLLKEMDEVFENMKIDGFIIDAGYGNNRDENHVSNIQKEAYENHKITIQKNKSQKECNNNIINQTHDRCMSLEEDFCEILSDDLENGSSVVEAYNDDGRELIIVQLSIDRKTVDLNSLQSIQEAIADSEMVIYENENRILSTVSEAQEIFVKTKYNIHTEPIYEEIGDYEPPTIRKPLESAENEDSAFSGVFNGEIPPRKYTISSVMSNESSDCKEDESPYYENIYSSARRETFCDNQGNIRIERIGYPEKSTESKDETVSRTLSRHNSLSSTKRLSYLIEEIKTTEVKYVEDLKKIVKRYIPYIVKHTPPQFTHLHDELFGNISRIYKTQKKFLEALLKCEEDVDSIAMTFIEHDHLFYLYPQYLRNKPKSDMIFKEFQPIIKQMQEYFEERLDFSAYLLTPLQRLGKYILLLENIEKELKKLKLSCENTQEALKIVKSVMSRGNDCVAIESIQHSPISQIDYGSFIMRDKFTIIKPRRLESMVFLFSEVLVFTIEDQKSLEFFIYYDSIKMEDLRIATFEDGTIHLTDFTKSKKRHVNPQRYNFVLETKVEKVRNSWRKTIEQVLWQQLARDKANALKTLPLAEKKKQSVKRRPKSIGKTRPLEV